MSIKGRVGRHTMAGGRQCQNWSADQQVVIDLLNRIPLAQGGAEGTLRGRIVSGISSDALYGAILVFEQPFFPGQHSGFVNPSGPMLRRMEQVATDANRQASPSPIAPPPESNLQILRRNLLDDSQATKVDPFWAMHKGSFQPLINMAYKHINNLIEMNLQQLPWQVELFGRAFVLSQDEMLMHFPTF